MSLLDPNDPTLIKIVHPSTRSSVTVSLKGATIVEWKIFSTNLLYLSPLADADVKSAVPIRGGIPLVFPNFGPTPANSSLPKHGFARTSQWTFVGTNVDENEDIIAIFQLEHSPQTLKVWPFKFQLQLQILLGMFLLFVFVASSFISIISIHQPQWATPDGLLWRNSTPNRPCKQTIPQFPVSRNDIFTN